MEFRPFKVAVMGQFDHMSRHVSHLFLTDVDKDTIWNTYLNSFPEGTNPIFKVRTEYDCNCCRQFLRPYANVVAIVDNKLVSIWDIVVDEPAYQTVANKLAILVKSAPVVNVFKSKFDKLGTDYSRVVGDDGKIIKWEHFYAKLSPKFIDRGAKSIESIQGDIREVKGVFKRSLEELSLESAQIIAELIAQNSLYRGKEFEGVINAFITNKKLYMDLPDDQKDNYCWTVAANGGNAVSKIRNTSIGTLLIDLSAGKELDRSVAAFERVVAPQNYKRPTPVVTTGMIESAQKTIEELGLLNSLSRRHATKDDITVNNVLFVDRSIAPVISVFDAMKGDVLVDPKKLSKIEEVTIEDFIKNVLPKITTMELLMEQSMEGNLMSLIAPTDPQALGMFKWNNNFSWAYKGDIADSIKEQVKAAGGNVEGEIRISLSWFNYDDLDLHAYEPNGTEICFHSNRKPEKTSHSGQLDVDMNAGGSHSRTPVENITWDNKSKMLEGVYKVYVHNYSKRESIDFGFIVEIEHGGQIHTFNYPLEVKSKQNVLVAEFTYNKATGIKFNTAIESKVISKEIWGVKTSQFQKVSMMMLSPNFWDDQKIGNQHYIFIMEGAKNPDPARGFFNEFLKEDLMIHRKVFELLAGKMKVEPSENQLTGLGFSSTQNNSVVAKVTGTFARTIKINF